MWRAEQPALPSQRRPATPLGVRGPGTHLVLWLVAAPPIVGYVLLRRASQGREPAIATRCDDLQKSSILAR